jgi:hypothetical protein
MYYSTYRNVSVIGYIVVIGLLSLLVFSISLGDGILYLIGFGLLGLIGLPIHFFLVGRRLDDYSGKIPMPNAGLGLFGVNIVDDRYGRPTVSDEELPEIPSDQSD